MNDERENDDYTIAFDPMIDTSGSAVDAGITGTVTTAKVCTFLHASAE